MRHKLNRRANHAPHAIVFNRMKYDGRIKEYAEKRTRDGKSKRKIIR